MCADGFTGIIGGQEKQEWLKKGNKVRIKSLVRVRQAFQHINKIKRDPIDMRLEGILSSKTVEGFSNRKVQAATNSFLIELHMRQLIVKGDEFTIF